MSKLNSWFLGAFLIFFTLQPTVQGQEVIPVDINIERDGIILKGKFYPAEGEGVFLL